jgi:arsenate reductase
LSQSNRRRIWKKVSGDQFEVFRAGIKSHGLTPKAVKAMAEKGIDISNQTSDIIDPEILKRADYVISLCGDDAINKKRTSA